MFSGRLTRADLARVRADKKQKEKEAKEKKEAKDKKERETPPRGHLRRMLPMLVTIPTSLTLLRPLLSFTSTTLLQQKPTGWR